MDNPKSLGELGEHYRRIAQAKMASGCKACQAEGRAMLEMVEDMERVNGVGETGNHSASCSIGPVNKSVQLPIGETDSGTDEAQQ